MAPERLRLAGAPADAAQLEAFLLERFGVRKGRRELARMAAFDPAVLIPPAERGRAKRRRRGRE